MKSFSTTVGIVLLLIGSCACSISANPLLGEWRVYRLQGPDGKVVDTPPEYDLRIVYGERQYVQYEPGKGPQRLDYSLKRDANGQYIKLRWNGQWYGQRFTVLENGDIRWDLFEPGTMRPTKMWMRRIQK